MIRLSKTQRLHDYMVLQGMNTDVSIAAIYEHLFGQVLVEREHKIMHQRVGSIVSRFNAKQGLQIVPGLKIKRTYRITTNA